MCDGVTDSPTPNPHPHRRNWTRSYAHPCYPPHNRNQPTPHERGCLRPKREHAPGTSCHTLSADAAPTRGFGITRWPDSGSMISRGLRDLPPGATAGCTAATLAPDRGSTISRGSRLRPPPAAAPTERSTLPPVLGSTTSRILRLAAALQTGFVSAGTLWGICKQDRKLVCINHTANTAPQHPNQKRLHVARAAWNPVTRIPPFKYCVCPERCWAVAAGLRGSHTPGSANLSSAHSAQADPANPANPPEPQHHFQRSSCSPLGERRRCLPPA